VADTSFQEVSGIGASVEITHGNGECAGPDSLSPVKHPNLVLKRGIAPVTSPLVLWCKSVFELDYRVPVVRLPVLVMLMNSDRIPKRVWLFNHAIPVSWSVDPFNSTKNDVAIESIDLNYDGLMRVV
jgi:phage tail-like protein